MMAGDRPPGDLASVDAALRGLSLEPRASLGPEIIGRAAAGERPWRSPRRRRLVPAAVAAAATLVLGTFGLRSGYVPAFDRFAPRSTVDRCCADLDGGGRADDGLLVETVRGRRVVRLSVYEEHDADRVWTPGEQIRFTRRGLPTLRAPQAGAALVTRELCCSDYDGGGQADDGVLVLASPDGDVLMAALFDRNTPRYPTLLR